MKYLKIRGKLFDNPSKIYDATVWTVSRCRTMRGKLVKLKEWATLWDLTVLHCNDVTERMFFPVWLCVVLQVPVIAIAGSGGGFRAMVGFSGVMKALYESGVLDCATYVAGLSGSTWCVLIRPCSLFSCPAFVCTFLYLPIYIFELLLFFLTLLWCCLSLIWQIFLHFSLWRISAFTTSYCSSCINPFKSIFLASIKRSDNISNFLPPLSLQVHVQPLLPPRLSK